MVPNGQGQGLEPPSKPIGCIPNYTWQWAFLGSCVVKRAFQAVSDVSEVSKVSEFDTIDTDGHDPRSHLSESPF